MCAAAAAKSLQSCLTLCNHQMASHQAPAFLGLSRQARWSGLPFPSPMHESEKWKWSHSVVSNSSRPHGLQPTRILHSWDFPGKSTGVGCHRLLWLSVWDERNCVVVWAFFGIAFLWDWNENWPFPVLSPKEKRAGLQLSTICSGEITNILIEIVTRNTICVLLSSYKKKVHWFFYDGTILFTCKNYNSGHFLNICIHILMSGGKFLSWELSKGNFCFALWWL